MNRLAINGGIPHKKKPFPGWPICGERELQLITEVTRSCRWWRMSGTKVEEFEKSFADHHGAKHCLCVTNGTHAIEIALASLGIGAGDDVLIPAFTFISTATAPVYCNARPVPVDVDPETFCMDPESLERSITPKSRAVIPVHLAGHSCDMDAICRIAEKYNLRVIEDAAHAHGAEWMDKKIGTLGDIATFSFQNGKLMTSGEGGALITNSSELFETAYLIHGVGRPKGDRTYRHLVLGSNYRMNEFQAAILIAQLERLAELNERREENAAILDDLLSGIEGVKPQGRASYATLHSHYMYMFYYDPGYFGGLGRTEFVDALIAEGIPVFIAYPVVTKTEFFRSNQFRGHLKEDIGGSLFNLTNADRIANEVIWLPHHTLLGDSRDVEEIAGAIRKIQNAMK